MKFLKNIYILLVAMVIGTAHNLQAQEVERTTTISNNKVSIQKIYFKINSSEIDEYYHFNLLALRSLERQLMRLKRENSVEEVYIYAVSSPEGRESFNKKLAIERAERIKSYLVKRNHNIPLELVKVRSQALKWEDMIAIIESDSQFKYKNEALAVINRGLNNGETERELRAIDKGRAWSYMMRNYSEIMRYADIDLMLPSSVELIAIAEETKSTHSIPATKLTETTAIQTKPVVEKREVHPVVERLTRYNYALKINMLYYLTALPNIELEIPIGDRWSLAAEFNSAWWVFDDGTWESLRHRMQTRLYFIEGRYWYGDREQRERLTGWFTGLYGGFGSFDLEYDTEGVQSKNLLTAGVTAGYAHTINKRGNLRLEYSLGVGYAQCDYKEYTAEYDGTQWGWDAYHDYTKKFTWFGPTRAKVSLVWMIGSRERRGR